MADSDRYLAHPAGLASDWEGNGRGADIPASAEKRLREEYTVSEDARYLHLNLTVQDSVYLSKPYQSTRVWERADESVAFEPFACDPRPRGGPRVTRFVDGTAIATVTAKL